MIVIVVLLIGLLSTTCAAGVGKAWEISSSKFPELTTHPSWPRLDLSAFEVRSISGVGHLKTHEHSTATEDPESSKEASPAKERTTSTEFRENDVAEEADDMENSRSPEILYDHPIFKKVNKSPHKDVEILPGGTWDKVENRRKGRNHGLCVENHDDLNQERPNFDDASEGNSRVRREVSEGDPMEKMSGVKSVREPRLGSPETWSKQPLSVEFRHRGRSDSASGDMIPSEDETSRAPLQSHEAPRTDFITANRRSYDVREARESREFPISRTYEDISVRVPLHERDYDATYSRGYYYPDHFRTEREYYVRGLNEPTAYPTDRYRVEDYDLFRNRPTPKPKRIIYYATLPEIVRKPVDLRSYSRPYDTMTRPSIPIMTRDGFPKRVPTLMDRDVETRYRYRSYPYSGYEPYAKRSSYLERPYMHLLPDRVEDDRYLDQDLDHASYKEVRSAAPNDESTNLTSDVAGSKRLEKLPPWPVQLGTEINVKEAQKVSGRKVFGQYHQDYDRFRPSTRVDHKENAENPGLVENRN